MGCANHPYLQLRAKLNYEGRSSTWSSRRLSKGAYGSQLMTHVWSRSTATVEGSVRGLIPTHSVNIPCGRTPEKTHDFPVERWLTLFTQVSLVRCEDRTSRGERRLPWRLCHRTLSEIYTQSNIKNLIFTWVHTQNKKISLRDVALKIVWQ